VAIKQIERLEPRRTSFAIDTYEMGFVMQRSRSVGSANQKFDSEHKGFQLSEFHHTPSKQQTNNK
jgi:hypothetical protein